MSKKPKTNKKFNASTEINFSAKSLNNTHDVGPSRNPNDSFDYQPSLFNTPLSTPPTSPNSSFKGFGSLKVQPSAQNASFSNSSDKSFRGFKNESMGRLKNRLNSLAKDAKSINKELSKTWSFFKENNISKTQNEIHEPIAGPSNQKPDASPNIFSTPDKGAIPKKSKTPKDTHVQNEHDLSDESPQLSVLERNITDSPPLSPPMPTPKPEIKGKKKKNTGLMKDLDPKHILNTPRRRGNAPHRRDADKFRDLFNF